MTGQEYKLVTNGDSGITVLFNEDISQQLSRQISAYAKICKQEFSGQLVQIIPAYQSLTLEYSPLKISPTTLCEKLDRILQTQVDFDSKKSQIIEIPVCYAAKFSPDIHTVSAHTALTPEEIIYKHTHTEYFVHMLGFSPGFLYLGGLPTELTCPRKSSPELQVPAGSVGIGGSQTGIYPQNSPGGWQIIGRTPIPLFDINKTPPCIASPMDLIVFKQISEQEFHQLEQLS